MPTMATIPSRTFPDEKRERKMNRKPNNLVEEGDRVWKTAGGWISSRWMLSVHFVGDGKSQLCCCGPQHLERLRTTPSSPISVCYYLELHGDIII